jgi:hypothetical protein
MRKYLFKMMRTSQPGGDTFQYSSFIHRLSTGQGYPKAFVTEEEFERVRQFVFPNEPNTKEEVRVRGYVQRDDRELTDEQAASLGWKFPSPDID